MTRWRRSRFYGLRVLGDSLKAVLTILYCSHPLVLRHIGIYKHCENAEDDYDMPTPPESGPLAIDLAAGAE